MTDALTDDGASLETIKAAISARMATLTDVSLLLMDDDAPFRN